MRDGSLSLITVFGLVDGAGDAPIGASFTGTWAAGAAGGALWAGDSVGVGVAWAWAGADDGRGFLGLLEGRGVDVAWLLLDSAAGGAGELLARGA